MKLTVSPYDHHGPGAIINTATGAVFIPADQLHRVAVRLLDINDEYDELEVTL